MALHDLGFAFAEKFDLVGRASHLRRQIAEGCVRHFAGFGIKVISELGPLENRTVSGN